MPPQQVFMFIIGTIVILFGAYYVTYYVGMKASGQTRAGMKNRNIRLIDRYAISRDKQFCIIEIAGKVYIVAAANNAMTLLDTIDAAEFARLAEDTTGGNTTPWNMTPVGQYGNFLTRKVVAFVAEKTGKTQQVSNDTQRNDITAGKSDFAENLKEAQEKSVFDKTGDTAVPEANEKISADNHEDTEED